MVQTRTHKYIKKLTDYLTLKTEMVDHQGIVREVASGVEHSWVYYLMLLMAGLIALLGLLTNSVAVVIGAMLISPLMGPIISTGLALTISDLSLARRAFRAIAVSVVMTILLSALVTVLSPLKEPTAEILARARPNIYDLLIAALSGIAGAVALCTKRNYMITATGVAVATAVIPPLSVVGYGLGTGQFMLALGGFFLFFTNFVAILLTSDLVFFIMGFRSRHLETIKYSQRTRFAVIAAVLSIISIPLIYTLVVDMKKVNTQKRIEQVLKKHLNRERESRMTGYTFLPQQGKLLVRATVNTIRLFEKKTEMQMVREMQERLKSPVDLQLEQVIVASEKLPAPRVEPTMFPSTTPSAAPRAETSTEISAKVNDLVSHAEKELADAFAPFHVSDTKLTFAGSQEPLHVTATLQRDYPVSNDELVLLSRLLERSLNVPVNLNISVTSFLPNLEFGKNGMLSPGSVEALAIIKKLPGGTTGFRFLIRSSESKNSRELVELKRHLIKELGVPINALSLVHSSPKPTEATTILRIVRIKEYQ